MSYLHNFTELLFLLPLWCSERSRHSPLSSAQCAKLKQLKRRLAAASRLDSHLATCAWPLQATLPDATLRLLYYKNETFNTPL